MMGDFPNFRGEDKNMPRTNGFMYKTQSNYKANNIQLYDSSKN